MTRPSWVSAVLAQSPAKTWKTIDELSVQELQMLDLRTTTPRDAQIPYLPAEAYPFSPPYTAEELAYLAFDLDAPRPRFSHIWLSVVQRMTAEGHILATLKNNTAILYHSADGGALMRLPAGQEYMRGLLQFTNPPAADGRQSLWMEYRTDQAFTKKQDRYSYTRRSWLVSPYKTRADVSRPDQFYLRPRLYPGKFPHHRPIRLTPLVAARVAAQERAGHLVFEVAAQPAAEPPTEGAR